MIILSEITEVTKEFEKAKFNCDERYYEVEGAVSEGGRNS